MNEKGKEAEEEKKQRREEREKREKKRMREGGKEGERKGREREGRDKKRETEQRGDLREGEIREGIEREPSIHYHYCMLLSCLILCAQLRPLFLLVGHYCSSIVPFILIIC